MRFKKDVLAGQRSDKRFGLVNGIAPNSIIVFGAILSGWLMSGRILFDEFVQGIK